MRVVAVEPFKSYWGGVVADVAIGEEFTGGYAEYLAVGGAPVRVVDEPDPHSDDAPPAELDIEATAAEVLAWVGEDPSRAGAALEAEQARDRPRSTLLKVLAKIAS